MKNKILSVLAILFVLCTCVCILTACGESEPPHTHNYATLKYDNENHWFECECGEKNDFEQHTPDDSGWCSVCDLALLPTNGICYEVSADGTYAEVIAYSGTSTKVNIASTYNGVPVTSIYSHAFENTAITTVVIPDSVTSIGYGAFQDCTSLSSVVIGDGVTNIGSYAFSCCRSLTSVVIPYGVTKIGDGAFSICSSLTSVVIPDNITWIGGMAFYGCHSLTSVVIPDGVTCIDVSASVFDGCTSLVYNTYGNIKYLGNENNPYLVAISTVNINFSSYELHEQTKILARSVFSNCARLTSITIPDSVTSIGKYAFNKCSSLTSVVIGSNVTSIGEGAFDICRSLEKVYYKGTENSWSSISIDNYGSGNGDLTWATRYYYSASQPTTSGNYWHYDQNGNVVVW